MSVPSSGLPPAGDVRFDEAVDQPAGPELQAPQPSGPDVQAPQPSGPDAQARQPAASELLTAPILLPRLPDGAKPAAGQAPALRTPILLIVGAILLLIAAVLSYRHGIATNLFPPYLADGGPTPIRRYSAPWIAGAAGLAIFAGLLLTSGVTRLVHYKL